LEVKIAGELGYCAGVSKAIEKAMAYGDEHHQVYSLGTIAHNEAYNDFGRWPVPAPLHGNQDVQFSKKLISLGYEFGYKEDVKCYHIDGTDGQEKKYPEYFKLRQRERRVKR